MFNLEEFNTVRDEDPPDPFEVAKDKGLVRGRIKSLDKGNDYDKRNVEIVAIKQRLKYIYKWQRYFPKNFAYKHILKKLYVMRSS